MIKKHIIFFRNLLLLFIISSCDITKKNEVSYYLHQSSIDNLNSLKNDKPVSHREFLCNNVLILLGGGMLHGNKVPVQFYLIYKDTMKSVVFESVFCVNQKGDSVELLVDKPGPFRRIKETTTMGGTLDLYALDSLTLDRDFVFGQSEIFITLEFKIDNIAYKLHYVLSQEIESVPNVLH